MLAAHNADDIPRLQAMDLILSATAGDIGTSPLYVISSTFSIGTGDTPSEDDIIGVISLILWSLTALLVFK